MEIGVTGVRGMGYMQVDTLTWFDPQIQRCDLKRGKEDMPLPKRRVAPKMEQNRPYPPLNLAM
jgi:hypothetical protein